MSIDGDLDNAATLEHDLGVPKGTLNDAALVLRAYERWGVDAFAYLRGRASIVIWDGSEGRLVAARDRVGAVPLFFARAGSALCLSTTVETLLAHEGVSAALNRAAIADHLCHRWPSTEETHYQAINRVPAAHLLSWKGGDHALSRYWSPVPSERPVRWVTDDEVDQFDALLDQAVARCLRHGQTGVFLSGGFDSVSIAAMALDRTRQGSSPAPIGLSLAFPHPECNEESMQRSVGSQLGLEHIVVPFDEAAGANGIVWSAMTINQHTALPMMNPWRPAYRRLGESGVANGCRVAVNGGGGDEFLTVGPAYMADLLRSLNVIGAAKYVSNTLRSFSLNKRLLLQNLLWKYGVRSLAVSQGTRALRAVAPDVLRRRWRRSLSVGGAALVGPRPGTPQGAGRARGAAGRAAIAARRPEWTFRILFSRVARRVPPPDAVAGSGRVVRQPPPGRAPGTAALLGQRPGRVPFQDTAPPAEPRWADQGPGQVCCRPSIPWAGL